VFKAIKQINAQSPLQHFNIFITLFNYENGIKKPGHGANPFYTFSSLTMYHYLSNIKFPFLM